NSKTCNKAIWTKDGRGQQTDYTYHPESGQIATVTQPANRQNVRPQTRYFYTAKYAYYKDSSGAYQQADTPIWLLTKESTCQNGAASGNGCAIRAARGGHAPERER
ncbi:MAG: hypothetical protein AAF517_22810, partial [Planctomycetota bacterium]